MISKGLQIFAATLLLVGGTTAFARQTDTPAIVFLVAGQSNAGGCGVLSPEVHRAMGRDEKRPLVPGSTAKEIGLSTEAADYTHSYIWVPGEGFQRANPQTNVRPTCGYLNSKWHGMELPVIRELEKRFPDNDVFVVKYGPGNTNLHHQWNPTREDGLYATFLGYYRKAMAQLSKDYPEVRVVGLYWDQGETDGINGKHGEYADNLKGFIAAVRRDTHVPKLKVFVRKHIFNWPNIETIIAAQEKVVADDPFCYLLDIDLGDRRKNDTAWAYSPGNGHVSSKGFVALTRKLFDGPLRDATVESFDTYGAAGAETKSTGTGAKAMIGNVETGRILFLGNSITWHRPKPSIGWTGNWGMAASSLENDYVHILTRSISEINGTSPVILAENISDFEAHYETYDLARLKKQLEFKADTVILAIGENVHGVRSEDSQARFRASVLKLLQALKDASNPTIIVRSSFWPDKIEDDILKGVCEEAGGVFVDISSLSKDESHYAREYSDKGVADHPSDKGMQAIADLLLEAMKNTKQGTDLLAKISYENVKYLRHSAQQKTPDWARKVFEEKIRVLKERAERNYKETGRWYYVKYENGDCGGGVWWDEVASDRVYVQLQGLLGGIEKLPNYSLENHKKAIVFWQGWQDEKTGLFHNPFFVDPQNPESKRNTEGYNPAQYRKKPVHERVVQKYLPGLLTALGSASVYEVAEDRKLAEEDVASTVRGIEKALIRGAGGSTIGNQVTRQIWVMADHIDGGKTELIPDYERLMAMLLRRFDAKTGLLGSGPNFGDYTTSANNVKCNARIIGYIGLENYPYRNALADSLANAFSKGGVGNAGAIRNWAYLSTLVLQQTDRRSDDLYTAIENLVAGLAKGGNPGYTWMALSTATAWLHWDIAPVEAFKDPSVALCYNGVNRPYRSVVGPFGRWVNLIPREPEATYGNPGFSWDKHSLRSRDAVHEKRKVIDIVPPSCEGWDKRTDEQGRVTLVRTFDLSSATLQAPYLKAKWNGDIEIYLNDVLVKKLSGDFRDYCGLRVPQGAAATLRKGNNIIAVRAVTPGAEPTLDVGLIDWK